MLFSELFSLIIFKTSRLGKRKTLMQIVCIHLMLLIILIIQIVYGAFVAGLDAGKVYNTWPKMDGKWITEAVYAMSPLWENFVNGLAGVQFIHRELAYVVLGLIIYIFF